MIKGINILFLLSLNLCLTAQSELMLFSIDSLFYSNKVKPQQQLPNQYGVGIVASSISYNNSSLIFRDIIAQNPDKSTYLNINHAIDLLDNKNTIDVGTSLDEFTYQFKFNNIQYFLFMSQRIEMHVEYSKEMINLLWSGNEPFIGEKIIIQPNFDFLYYKELGLGISKSFKGFDLGVNLKLLNGITIVNAQNGWLSLKTEEERYAIGIEADYSIGYSDIDRMDKWPHLPAPFGNIKDLGFAVDLGATYKFEQSNLSLSLLDLGYINWKNNYQRINNQGSYTFRGLSISNFFTADTIQLDSYLDSLENTFLPQKEKVNYRSNLTPKAYINYNVQFDKKHTIGFTILYSNRERYYYASNFTYKLKPWLHAGANYTFTKTQWNNFGLYTRLKYKGIEVYAMTDNITNVIWVKTRKYFNLRIGISVYFDETPKYFSKFNALGKLFKNQL